MEAIDEIGELEVGEADWLLPLLAPKEPPSWPLLLLFAPPKRVDDEIATDDEDDDDDDGSEPVVDEDEDDGEAEFEGDDFGLL